MGKCDVDIQGGFSRKACLLWLSYITSNTRYFEWGSGFTTRTADKIASRVTSVEGSYSWYKYMTSYNLSHTTRLLYVDIGKTGAFSHPINRNVDSRPYINAINTTQDVVLVDGRWRVACAISSFRFIEPDGRLMIHDFNRRSYHTILKFYDKERESGNLAIFKRKHNISDAELQHYEAIFETDTNR